MFMALQIGSIYEGGVFDLSIYFPSDYPFNPPKIKFTGHTYHPNISNAGLVDMDSMAGSWTAGRTVKDGKLSILT